jgi:hypothetical protein
LKNKEQVADTYYENTFNDYLNVKYDSALYKIEMSDVVLKPNPLSAKFELLKALIYAKQNRLGDYVTQLNKIINRSPDVAIKKTASDMLALLNKSSLKQEDLSKDPARRDSLNSFVYKPNLGRPDSAQMDLLKKLDAAKQKAMPKGPIAKTDTANKPVATKGSATKDSVGKAAVNVATVSDTSASNALAEDTTGPYKRSDEAVHYFIIYFTDPSVPQSAIMSTMAKVDAYNSTQFPTKRLQTKQVLIDSKNKLLNVRQFKNKEDVMAYYNAIKTHTELFSDMKNGQFAITAISTTNFSTLLSEKKVDEYNKFFNRVYNK